MNNTFRKNKTRCAPAIIKYQLNTERIELLYTVKISVSYHQKVATAEQQHL